MLYRLIFLSLIAAVLAFPTIVRAQPAEQAEQAEQAAPAAPPAAATESPAAPVPGSVPPPPVVTDRPAAATETPAAPPAAAPAAPSAAEAPAVPEERSPAFIRLVEFELIRVGCGVFAPDGGWGEDAREALIRFNEHGRWRFDPARPTRALLTALQRNEARVCPPDCEAGFELRGMSCVAAVTPTPVPVRREAVKPVASPRTAAPPRAAPQGQPARSRREAPPRRSAKPQRRETQPRRQARPAQRPSRSAPAGCYIDLGYGRRQPCDAGGGI